MTAAAAVPPPAPDPLCPAAWATDRAAAGFLHCILDPVLAPHGAEGWHEDPENGRWKITLSMGDFPVSGRSVLRGSGEAVAHQIRYHAVIIDDQPAISARCDGCPDWRVHLEDGHSHEELTRLAVQHEGGEPS